MAILFLFVGLLFVAGGVGIVLSEARNRRGAVAVSGRVIGYSTGRREASGGYFHPVVEYPGLDGLPHYVEGSVGSSVPLSALGDPVTVLVQPDDAAKATLASPLTYVVGGVIALMGGVPCAVFFAVFRADLFSIGGAVALTAFLAHKLRSALRDKPMSLERWREFKRTITGSRVFTEATKATIPWADPAALQTAVRSQRRGSRIAIPLLMLGGIGLMFLGDHLRRRTELFLEKALHARGRVVDLASLHTTDSHTFAPVVQFQHDGRKVEFRDSIGSNPPAYRVGDWVDVLYNPDEPGDARIDRGAWNKGIPFAIGGFGILSCLLGAWSLKRRPTVWPPLEPNL